MSTSSDLPVRVLPAREDGAVSRPLFDVAGTRRIEAAALSRTPAHALMQRAGLACARLASAWAPHARTVWVAAGPGNNGGDGLEAAAHLKRWGRTVVVTWMGTPERASDDTRAAWQSAQAAGVEFALEPPAQFDLCIDALLGIGATRAPDGRMAQWIACMNRQRPAVLSIDVPTGLDADTGKAAHDVVRAGATLCLLTLKPGLFTGQGRDASREVWLDSLGVDPDGGATRGLATPCATLAGAPLAQARPHASHKGSFGDVAVVGGDSGMLGAALLAGSAALHSGAGRVYLATAGAAAFPVDPQQPELMLRSVEQLDPAQTTIVCGCGGGDFVRSALPRILAEAQRLVLDADALNALAQDTQLQSQLQARSARGWHTVLTPHPLEAARLLGIAARDVQDSRLMQAMRLADKFQCTVVLKGSGTIVATCGAPPSINPTGNARLATAGTGDVLAGAIGANLAGGAGAHQAATETVYIHGRCADNWPSDRTLTASRLARALQRAGA